jgi:hypothetical protein
VSTYQDVVSADNALAAWALTEASGLAFVPYIGGSNLVGSGTFTYQQTGPFAASFGLQFAVGAKATLTFATVVNPPVTVEAWVKLSSATPSSPQFLWGTGNGAANGVQPYVSTAGHIRIQLGGVQDTDTGVIWPDTNWHLVEVASSSSLNVLTLMLDGVVRWRQQLGTAGAPSPNTLTFFGHSGAGSGIVATLAMPAFYAYEYTAAQAAATFLAATNPNAALGATLSGGGINQALAQTTLDLILASVRKTY